MIPLMFLVSTLIVLIIKLELRHKTLIRSDVYN